MPARGMCRPVPRGSPCPCTHAYGDRPTAKKVV
uniref:Uncharacterized protein n=1 Tax=Podoviridae sp. ct2iq11 TaxID=2827720 RepID=A0A8S5TPK3_9CAUD|nr:MAG TPA: hypothetical protein [Podoviridae sp. ct2iq11]